MTAEKGGRTGAGRSALRAAAWIWLFGVVALILSGTAGIGPGAWADSRFALRTGQLASSYYLHLTFLLGAPAFWVLVAQMDGKDEVPQPRRRARAAALLALAAGCLVMAGIAWQLLERAPNGSEPAPLLAPGALADGAAAGGPVTLRGALIARASVRFAQASRQGSTWWRYTGFRPGATRSAVEAEGPGAASVVLFVEDASKYRPPVLRRWLPETEEVRGYLIENGLPAHARIQLEREGVRIATPHYLLREAGALRARYYPPLLLGLLFAFLFAIAALHWRW